MYNMHARIHKCLYAWCTYICHSKKISTSVYSTFLLTTYSRVCSGSGERPKGECEIFNLKKGMTTAIVSTGHGQK